MKQKTIFEFREYKAYLTHVEQFRGTFQRGFRSRLAEEVGCQNAFISQVLNRGAHFSLEQSYKVAQFLKLDENERQYFFWLVEHGRAGTVELKEFFEKLLHGLRDRSLELKDRVRAPTILTSDDKAMYYSQWYFAAIHVAVTIPGLRHATDIASALGLPLTTVQKATLFLASCGLIQEKSGQLFPGPTQLHVERGAPQTFNHHANWRVAAIASLAKEKSSDVHYSTVSSLSRKDAELLRAQFVAQIESYVETVKSSPEQTLYGFNLDFFRLID